MGRKEEESRGFLGIGEAVESMQWWEVGATCMGCQDASC